MRPSMQVPPTLRRLRGLDADVVAWRNRVIAGGGIVTDADAAAVNAFVVSAKSIGLTDANSRINAFAGESLTAALYPVFRGGGPDADTNVNFVAGDYTKGTGITGNGTTKYLNTGVNANAFTAANRHLGVYLRGSTAGSFDKLIGAETAFNTQRWALGGNGTALREVYFADAGNGGAAAGSSTVGHVLGTGTATNAILYDDGVSAATQAVSAATPGATSVYVFALDSNGTAADFSNAQLGGYSIGPGLTAGQVATFAAAWQTLMTAFGRQV
jgi:hypothetical protein